VAKAQQWLVICGPKARKRKKKKNSEEEKMEQKTRNGVGYLKIKGHVVERTPTKTGGLMISITTSDFIKTGVFVDKEHVSEVPGMFEPVEYNLRESKDGFCSVKF